MISKITLTNRIIVIIVLFFIKSANANIVNQYFIKITPNVPLVNCGKLKIKKVKTELNSFLGKEDSNNIKPEDALKLINDSILLKSPKTSKIVFFVHGFWASLPFAIHRTSKGFKQNYYKDEKETPIIVIHILWDANDVLYKHSIENLNNSTKVFSEIMNKIESSLTFKTSLMCHSMGNRFLYQTLLKEKPKVYFENLLLIAPDLDYRKFEENHELFTSLAETVDVFYNEKDNTLNMSKGINKIERLGRMNKSHIEEKINFIDCTSVSDINTFSDSIMKHLYYITSQTVIAKIEKILIN